MKTTTSPLSHNTFVAVLAGLTHGILHDANAATRTHADASAASKRSWLDRLDTWLWNQEVRSREAFLARSVDIVDLEQRQRWLERGHG